VVTSTFGAMFAPDQARRASEGIKIFDAAQYVPLGDLWMHVHLPTMVSAV
jgi:hypothetical protein